MAVGKKSDLIIFNVGIPGEEWQYFSSLADVLPGKKLSKTVLEQTTKNIIANPELAGGYGFEVQVLTGDAAVEAAAIMETQRERIQSEKELKAAQEVYAKAADDVKRKLCRALCSQPLDAVDGMLKKYSNGLTVAQVKALLETNFAKDASFDLLFKLDEIRDKRAAQNRSNSKSKTS